MNDMLNNNKAVSNRRGFIHNAALVSAGQILPKFVLTIVWCLSVLMSGAQSKARSPIGVVSYTFRASFASNFEATLDTIKSFGIDNIEFSNLFGQKPERIRELLDKKGMYCTSYGVSYDDLTKKTKEVGQIAKILGAEFVRVAWIPHDGDFTSIHAEQAINDFNAAGKILKNEYDLDFCYHNHGYEFSKWEDGTLFDLLATKTDPAYVNFEMDMLWVHIADVSPAELLKKYPTRFRLMHIKDLKKGTAHGLTGKTDPANDVTLGEGEINIPPVLKAAKRSSVKYYYLEDESPEATQHVGASLRYVKKFIH